MSSEYRAFVRDVLVLGWSPSGEEITQAVDGFSQVLCPWQGHNAQVIGVRPVKAGALH